MCKCQIKTILQIVLVSTVALLASAKTSADIVFIVENKHAGPGTTAFVSVSAYTTTSNVLNGYNLPIDVDDDGQGLPPGLTFDVPPIQNPNPSIPIVTLNTTLNAVLDIDGIANGVGGSDVALSTNPALPTKLFDLAFDIDISVPLGTLIPISIVTTSPVNQFTVAPNAPRSAVAGSLFITVVPESATLISTAMGVICACAAAYSYRQRRIAASN